MSFNTKGAIKDFSCLFQGLGIGLIFNNKLILGLIFWTVGIFTYHFLDKIFAKLNKDVQK